MARRSELKFHVIKRGQKFVLSEGIPEWVTSPSQKAALALLIWDQVEHLMRANGAPPQKPNDVDRAAGEITGSNMSSVSRMRYAVTKKPTLLSLLLSGELTINEAAREVGHSTKRARTEASAISGGTYWGKGDKFDEVLEPLRRYLLSWEKQGFEYRHLNPKEAAQRVAVLDVVEPLLREARKDLEARAHVATSRIRSESERRRES